MLNKSEKKNRTNLQELVAEHVKRKNKKENEGSGGKGSRVMVRNCDGNTTSSNSGGKIKNR